MQNHILAKERIERIKAEVPKLLNESPTCVLTRAQCHFRDDGEPDTYRVAVHLSDGTHKDFVLFEMAIRHSSERDQLQKHLGPLAAHWRKVTAGFRSDSEDRCTPA